MTDKKHSLFIVDLYSTVNRLGSPQGFSQVKNTTTITTNNNNSNTNKMIIMTDKKH